MLYFEYPLVSSVCDMGRHLTTTLTDSERLLAYNTWGETRNQFPYNGGTTHHVLHCYYGNPHDDGL